MLNSILPGLAASPNVHPLFLHLPVALWLVAAAAWTLWLVRRSDALWQFGRWSLRIGLLGAVPALISGYLAADALGHDSPGHHLVHAHRDWMLWASGLALLTVVVDQALARRSDLPARSVVVAFAAATAVVMGLGADRGGEMVFRFGIGTAGESPATDGGHHHDGEAHPEAHAPSAPAPAVKKAQGKALAPKVKAKKKAPPGHEGHDHAH
jgi:uncharacterized membrane protein